MDVEHYVKARALQPVDCHRETITGRRLNDILDKLRSVGLDTAPAARALNRALIGDTVIVDTRLYIAQLAAVRQAQFQQRSLLMKAHTKGELCGDLRLNGLARGGVRVPPKLGNRRIRSAPAIDERL